MDEHETRVKQDLEFIAYPKKRWVLPKKHSSGNHVYDVLIVGGGQCGLSTAFGLMRENIDNIIVLDENIKGKEGPWDTFARMNTLRTNKWLTGPDHGIPSLTFPAYYIAKYGQVNWNQLDKIPKSEWMAYLVWYRKILDLPVRNSSKVTKITFDELEGVFEVLLLGNCDPLYARKIVLATGMDGGGHWYIPEFIVNSLPKSLYAHTSEYIDFKALNGKRVAILGGGASAFDNAQYALKEGVGNVDVFVRRAEIPKINPIRHMEYTGFLKHFSDLDEYTKYKGIEYFMQFNQPPTNDTFSRATSYPNFTLHTNSPILKLTPENGKFHIHTHNGDHGVYDFLIVSTGFLMDLSKRQELSAFSDNIATWRDRIEEANALIRTYPYLGSNFEFQEKIKGKTPYLSSIFAFNYSALVSLGLSGSALSGMKYALQKLINGVTRQLFLDDANTYVEKYLSYQEEEFDF